MDKVGSRALSAMVYSKAQQESRRRGVARGIQITKLYSTQLSSISSSIHGESEQEIPNRNTAAEERELSPPGSNERDMKPNLWIVKIRRVHAGLVVVWSAPAHVTGDEAAEPLRTRVTMSSDLVS